MARLDTGWHAHPKILALGLAGMGLHAWSISYSDHALSDGFIPRGAWPALPGVTIAVKRLVAAGLWKAVAGGYQVHDYADYNRLKAQVEALRQEDRVRKESGRTHRRSPAGHKPESGRIPRAPGPGPGPGPGDVAAADAGRIARPRAHETDPKLLAEHLMFIAQERARTGGGGSSDLENLANGEES